MEWDRMYEHMKAQQFELGATMPMGWKYTAQELMHAANRLFDIYHDGTLRMISRFVQEIQSGTVQDQDASGRLLVGDELEDHWDSQLIGVYFFLMGCSLENLLKGILMSLHPEYFQASGELIRIQSHDLVKLCRRCNIDLSQEEKELLTKLTTYVTWAGRYPVPLKAAEMFPKKRADGTWIQRGEPFHRREPQSEVNQMWMRLWEELERQHTKVDVGL